MRYIGRDEPQQAIEIAAHAARGGIASGRGDCQQVELRRRERKEQRYCIVDIGLWRAICHIGIYDQRNPLLHQITP